MVLSASVAKRVLDTRAPPRVPISLDGDFVKSGGVLSMFSGKTKLRVPVLPVPFAGFDASVPVKEAYVDVMDMAECLNLNARMPDRIIGAIACVAAGKAFSDVGSLSVSGLGN